MITTGVIAILASMSYFYASAVIWNKIQNPQKADVHVRVIKAAMLAVVLHAYTLNNTLYIDEHIHFNLGNGISLVALLASSILLVTHLNKPTETLGIFIYPVAALSTLLPLNISTTMELPLELGSHVLISIAAYSIMGIATAQAILYSIQEKHFKTKKLSKLMLALPPLQIMESTLIQLLRIGFVFLTFALISGVFFVENLFEQQLIHKTFFAMLAWVVYGAFLFGHLQYGWRGQRASKYTIWAYVLLILSYIGTSFIIEYIVE